MTVDTTVARSVGSGAALDGTSRVARGRLRRLIPDSFLLVAPLCYLAWMVVLYRARGPFWMMTPQDLSYNYLLNAVNVLNGDPIGTLIHPALTTIGYIAAVTWTTHLFVGMGPLDVDVIHNPEFYFSVSAHGITLLTALSLFLMGRWAYQGLRDARLVVLLQSFVFLTSPGSLVLNSWASPESMVVILSMLQAGLTIRTIDGRLDDPRERRRYVWASAAIGSAAVATKFIALPLLVVPFLVVPTWRARAAYCLGLVAGIAVCFSPIALVPAHRQQFLGDMAALLGSAASESQSRGATGALSSYAVQLGPILNGFPVYVYALLLSLLLLSVLVLHRGFRAVVTRDCRWAMRIFLASVAVLALGLVFVLIRPKPSYLVPYTPYIMISGATFAVMAAAYFAIGGRRAPWRASAVVPICICAFLLGRLFAEHAVANHDLFGNYSAAVQMKSLSYDAPGNNAVVTAIQASNVPTALYHAYMTSHQLNGDILADAVPRNHYDYAYDGQNANHYVSGQVTFAELQEMYDRVFFWTTMGNFARAEWRVPPEAIWDDVRVAALERLSSVEALAIGGRFDARAPATVNAARGWTSSQCGGGASCLAFATDVLDRKLVTHLRFFAESDRVAAMPARWRLEGSNDGQTWQAVEEFSDYRPWTVLGDVEWPPLYKRAEETAQNRIYRLNAPRFYPRYRLIFPPAAGHWTPVPGQVVAYSSGGCAEEVRVLPVRTMFVAKDDSAAPAVDMISKGFWEETGGAPWYLTSAPAPLEPLRYLLGTGEDGLNGQDAWGRMPRSWVLEGTRDDERWYVLDRQEGVAQWKPNETRAFPLKGGDAFSRFRFVIQDAFDKKILRIYKARVEGRMVAAARRKAKPGEGAAGGFYERGEPFPVVLQTEFEAPTVVSSYRMDVGPYGSDSTSRMPSVWRVVGSADGETWQVLDTRGGESGWTNGEQRVYRVSNAGAFRYVRLEVADVAGSNRVFRLSSLRYFTRRTTPAKPYCS